jgi:rare lipoprotein A
VIRWLWTAALAAALSACGGHRGGGYFQDDGPHDRPWIDVDTVSDAVPRDEPLSRSGNAPYIVGGVTYYPVNDSQGYRERGIASWYGKKFHGRRTSSGETYDMYAMTAAHRTLPLPSFVRVRNLENGRSAVVRVNDRGPFLNNRLIDLSYAAAARLGIIGSGTGIVEVEAVGPQDAENKLAQASKMEFISPAAADEARTPPPQPPRLYLQVGAFETWDNAMNLRTRLERAAFRPIFIQSTLASNAAIHTRVYRVRIGPIANVAEADRLAAQLAQYGVAIAIVVVE